MVSGSAKISKAFHVLGITGHKYTLTFTPQNVRGGCRLFTHEEFASLELKDCQDKTWQQWELDNYKSFQWLYLERLNALDPERSWESEE